MTITAILVLRTTGDASASSSGGGDGEVAVLATASDVSSFSIFQPAVREFIVFVARTVALRTAAGSRHTVQHEEYKVHCCNRNGLCAVVFTDEHYPDMSAHSILIKVLEEYQKNFGDSWRTAKDDAAQPWQYLDDALTKYQDPPKADKLIKIQRDSDVTKIIIHKTIDSVLQNGEQLDSLVAKSSDLSASSQRLYMQQQQQQHQATETATLAYLEPGPLKDFVRAHAQTNPATGELIITNETLVELKNKLHTTIETVLERGEQLDSLVAKSSDLSAASQMFYKRAKKTNFFCTIL